jgi:hypothetical protein
MASRKSLLATIATVKQISLNPQHHCTTDDACQFKQVMRSCIEAVAGQFPDQELSILLTIHTAHYRT